MSINIYKNGALQTVAGSSVMDAQLDSNSTNGVQNKVVTAAINQINNNLTANNNQYIATYQNGKYGFMVGNTFYEIGGGSMPILDYANPLHTFNTGSLTYITTQECWLVGAVLGSITIDGVIYGTNNVNGVPSIIAPLHLDAGSTITISVVSTMLHVLKAI